MAALAALRRCGPQRRYAHAKCQANNARLSPVPYLQRAAILNPDKTAVKYGDDISLTYSELMVRKISVVVVVMCWLDCGVSLDGALCCVSNFPRRPCCCDVQPSATRDKRHARPLWLYHCGACKEWWPLPFGRIVGTLRLVQGVLPHSTRQHVYCPSACRAWHVCKKSSTAADGDFHHMQDTTLPRH